MLCKCILITRYAKIVHNFVIFESYHGPKFRQKPSVNKLYFLGAINSIYSNNSEFFSSYYSYVNAKVIPVFHCIIKRGTSRFQVSSKEYWWHMRTRLSCVRMIRLHAHPLHPSPVRELSLFLNLPLCRLSRNCRERGGKGGRGAKSYDREENLLLNKSFNTLWLSPFCLCNYLLYVFSKLLYIILSTFTSFFMPAVVEKEEI